MVIACTNSEHSYIKAYSNRAGLAGLIRTLRHVEMISLCDYPVAERERKSPVPGSKARIVVDAGKSRCNCLIPAYAMVFYP